MARGVHTQAALFVFSHPHPPIIPAYALIRRSATTSVTLTPHRKPNLQPKTGSNLVQTLRADCTTRLSGLVATPSSHRKTFRRLDCGSVVQYALILTDSRLCLFRREGLLLPVPARCHEFNSPWLPDRTADGSNAGRRPAPSEATDPREHTAGNHRYPAGRSSFLLRLPP